MTSPALDDDQADQARHDDQADQARHDEGSWRRRLTRRNILIAVGLVVWLAATVALFAAMEYGPGERIGVSPPRPGHQVGSGVYANPPFLGFTDWPMFAQVYVFFEALAIYCWFGWTSYRQRRFRPMLVLLIVATLIAPIFDPLISWAAYTAYDPRLWHVPETWPLYDLLPTVQPLASLPGYAMFFVCSVAPGLWLHQRLTRKGGPDAVVVRRPLLTLFLIVGCFAFLFDALQAFLATRLEIITYTQIATAALRPGTTWQSNLFWEPILCFVMFGLAALTVYEDADGNTIATRWKRLRNYPITREFVVSLVVVSAASTIYTGAFALVRISGAATMVACPWPYQDTKVYDPDGLYAKTCPENPLSPAPRG